MRRYARWLRSGRLWSALAWTAALGAAAWGLAALEPRVRRINTAPTVIEWVGVPEWLNYESFRDVLPALEQAVGLDPQTDPYDPRVCPYVAERVAASPWVAGVYRVSKQADGRVRVRAEFRKPFAWVRKGLVAYLVDEHGVRLPREVAAADINRSDWWVIEGVAAPALGRRGAGGRAEACPLSLSGRRGREAALPSHAAGDRRQQLPRPGGSASRVVAAGYEESAKLYSLGAAPRGRIWY